MALLETILSNFTKFVFFLLLLWRKRKRKKFRFLYKAEADGEQRWGKKTIRRAVRECVWSGELNAGRTFSAGFLDFFLFAKCTSSLDIIESRCVTAVWNVFLHFQKLTIGCQKVWSPKISGVTAHKIGKFDEKRSDAAAAKNNCNWKRNKELISRNDEQDRDARDIESQFILWRQRRSFFSYLNLSFWSFFLYRFAIPLVELFFQKETTFDNEDKKWG